MFAHQASLRKKGKTWEKRSPLKLSMFTFAAAKWPLNETSQADSGGVVLVVEKFTHDAFFMTLNYEDDNASNDYAMPCGVAEGKGVTVG